MAELARVTLSAGNVSHVFAAVRYVPSPHSTGGVSTTGGVTAGSVFGAGSLLLERAARRIPRAIQGRTRMVCRSLEEVSWRDRGDLGEPRPRVGEAGMGRASHGACQPAQRAQGPTF